MSASPEKITLRKWIEDNEKVLTVMGVFAALTAYFSQLPNQTATSPRNATLALTSGQTGAFYLLPNVVDYLTIVSLAAFLLLLVEVWRPLGKERIGNVSERLVLFGFFLVALLILMVMYLVQTYRTALFQASLLQVVLMGFYGYVGLKVYSKSGVSAKAAGFAQRHQRIVLIGFFFRIALTLVLSMILAIVSSVLILQLIPK